MECEMGRGGEGSLGTAQQRRTGEEWVYDNLYRLS